MKNQLPLSILFVFFFAFSLSAQNSLPMDASPYTEYTPQQKMEINNLLDNTKNTLISKLRRSKDDEYVSKVLVTSSYKFAKGYSEIMESKNVPFKLVTSSTSFLNCWASENFETTGECWDQYLYKVNGAQFSSLTK